jgi:hypothetical protein
MAEGLFQNGMSLFELLIKNTHISVDLKKNKKYHENQRKKRTLTKYI